MGEFPNAYCQGRDFSRFLGEMFDPLETQQSCIFTTWTRVGNVTQKSLKMYHFPQMGLEYVYDFFCVSCRYIYQTHRSYGIGDPFWEFFRFSCCLFWVAWVFRVLVVLLFTAPASCRIVARSNLFDSMGHSVPSFFGRQLCQWPYLEGPESRVRCGSH